MVELIVVAEQTLEEGLIRQGEVGQVVVRAVDKGEVVAAFDAEGGEVVVGANEIQESVTVANAETLHVVTAAHEGRERRQPGNDHGRDFVVVDVEVLEVFDAHEVEVVWDTRYWKGKAEGLRLMSGISPQPFFHLGL